MGRWRSPLGRHLMVPPRVGAAFTGSGRGRHGAPNMLTRRSSRHAEHATSRLCQEKLPHTAQDES